MQSTVISMIEEQFPGTELNQEEVNRIVGKCCRPLYGYTLNVYQEINTFIGEKMQRFASNERRSIQQLPVNQKLRHVLAYFQRRFEEVKLRWENNPSLVRTEFEQELPQEAYEAMRARLSAIDQMVSSEEELAGQLLLSLQAQKEEAIQQQLSALQAAIAKLTADEQAGEQNIAHLNQALANRQANLQQAQQEIIRLNGLLQQLIGSRAPGNLIAAHRAQINAEIARIQGLIPQIQAEINQISTILQGVNQGMAELRAYKSDLVQNGERKIRAEIEEKVAVRVAEIEALKGTLPQRIADALRSLGIEMLTKACSPDIEALKSTDESIQHFSRIIATGEEEHHHSVSKKYTHRVLGFSSQDIAKETNERFRIVGGCGMSLPNLTSKPLPQADLFLEVLAENCSDQQEEISTFSCRGKSYSAQRMTTQFIPMVKKITSPHQEDILQWLTQIAEAENIPEQFPETLLEQPLDASGAKLIHYAAQLLPGPLFEALLAKNPNQANYTDSLGHLPIHVASQEGNLEVVLSILSCFPEQKDSFTQSGMTPLLLATQHGQTAIVEALVQQGVDANKRLPNGLFPLYIAIQNNFSEMALLLLEKVPHLITNEKLDSGMTPLHQAIEFDLQAVALQLIAKGAKGDVKRKSDGYTPLHLAAASGQLEVLTAIVNSGISASLELESHQHALHLAAQNGHLDIVNTLLSLNVDVNTKDDAGNTPLMCAIKSGHADIALRLAEVAKIDEQNARGQTVSSLALMYGLPEVADRLIARGENILLCDDEQQHSFYHFIRNSEYQRVAALIEEKPQLLAIQYQDLNLLELSAKFKQTYLVYLFLNQGLQFANDHRTTLAKFAVKVDEMSLLRDCIEPEIIPELTVIAAESGSYRCLAELLPQLKTSEIDSLELLKKAIASGHLETIRLVISKCSNINKPLDSMGNTALHLATNLGLREVIELLLESGSDITLSNHASQTAFHIAIVQNDHYLLKRLFKLTKPSEWPKQLQLDGIKREAPIEKLLQRYAVRTGNRTEQVVNAASPVFYQGLLPQDKVEELALLLKQSNFVGASDLLEECPDVINAFKTEEGGAFLRLVFANIQDIDGGAEERESISPKRFLNQLKQAHVNPALYTGQQNTLLSMVTAEDDKTACERFKYFIEFFSDALPTLVQDKIGKIQTVSQLALRHNKRDLFHQLHTFYLASANSQFDVTMISALHEAVLSEQYDLVEHFLQHHPVDSFNHKKQTALMLAAAQGNTRIVALLMNQGADAEKRDIEGHSALHYALFAKKEDVALTLIPYMSNPNRANRYGVTPLSLASANGILSVVRFIVEGKNYTQQVDDTGKTALHHAALKGQEKVIEYLVSQGFDVNAVDAPTRPSKQRSCKKTTPLHCAASKGHARAVMKLLALGADPTLSDSRGKTVCDYAVFSQDKEMQSVVEQLAMYQQKEQQVSLLFTAVQTDHLEVFDTLILEGADLSVLDGEGLSLAHRCAQFDAIKILKRLLIGDDTILELTDKLGNSALHYAAIRGHVSIIDYLVAAGASINLRNQENKSALYMACEQGKLGAVIALMKGNADVTLKSYEGLTPLQVALLNGHISIAYELALIGDTSWKLPAIQALTPEQQQKIMEGPYIAFMATYQKTDTMRMERGIFHHGLFKIGPVNHIGQERTNELSAV